MLSTSQLGPIWPHSEQQIKTTEQYICAFPETKKNCHFYGKKIPPELAETDKWS